jgi:hypothetical protein
VYDGQWSWKTTPMTVSIIELIMAVCNLLSNYPRITMLWLTRTGLFPDFIGESLTITMYRSHHLEV